MLVAYRIYHGLAFKVSFSAYHLAIISRIKFIFVCINYSTLINKNNNIYIVTLLGHKIQVMVVPYRTASIFGGMTEIYKSVTISI